MSPPWFCPTEPGRRSARYGTGLYPIANGAVGCPNRLGAKNLTRLHFRMKRNDRKLCLKPHQDHDLSDLLDGNRLSVAEIAVRLRVSEPTVRRWIAREVRGRRLPSYLAGGRRFVLRDDLVAFLGHDSLTTKKEVSSHATFPVPKVESQRARMAGDALDKLLG